MSKASVRPIGSIKLHAHTLEEAVHIDESPVTLTISGNRSNGEPAQAKIHVPHPFTYLMMKLFAFRDRKEDGDKNLGRHHALDLYTIVAMQVESEYQESLHLGSLYGGEGHVETAREIIRSDFAAPTSIGVIRLREHPLFRPEFPVGFLAVLSDIFARKNSLIGRSRSNFKSIRLLKSRRLRVEPISFGCLWSTASVSAELYRYHVKSFTNVLARNRST
jgi:hypothetical protein